eukprot:8699771-Karenia_brevis.AAC.1
MSVFSSCLVNLGMVASIAQVCQLVLWQTSYLGIRVGEASNPGPGSMWAMCAMMSTLAWLITVLL